MAPHLIKAVLRARKDWLFVVSVEKFSLGIIRDNFVRINHPNHDFESFSERNS